eukprot:scaffold64449_cov16-Tisochrysis_lutea.AAC.1
MAQWAQMFWAPKTLLKTSWETSASVTGIVELARTAFVCVSLAASDPGHYPLLWHHACFSFIVASAA